MVLINFFDKDVINTLVPVLTVVPDRVFMIYDKVYCKLSKLENVKKAINRHYSNIKVEFIACDSKNIENISCIIMDIKKNCPDDDIYCDVTGGPELMVSAGCFVSKECGITPLYLDLEKKVLFNVFNTKMQFKIAEVSIDDYLAAIGARHHMDSHYIPSKEEFAAILEMSEYLFAHLSEWSRMQKFIAETCSGDDCMSFVFDRGFFREKADEAQNMLNKFESLGFLIKNSRIDYEFPSLKYKQYLTTYGIWLEMYTYIKALECYKEVYIGFIIDWDINNGRDTNDNEIDVVLMDGYNPVFISCKTRKPEAKDVYEVAFLAERLGGKRAISVLCTTYPIKEGMDSPSSIYNRLKKSDVGYIEVKDFRKEEASYVLDRAISVGKKP